MVYDDWRDGTIERGMDELSVQQKTLIRSSVKSFDETANVSKQGIKSTAAEINPKMFP